MSRKEKAFKLFEEGKVARDPEVKALCLKNTIRYNYYSEWQQSMRLVSPSPEVAGEANGNGKAKIPSPEVVEAK